MGKAAIYHYSVGQNLHPGFTNNRIKVIEDYARSQGYDDIETYRDSSRVRKGQVEFKRFMSEYEKYEALFIQDLSQLSQTSMRCMSINKQLVDSGLTVFTLRNGIFCNEEDVTNKALKIATYYNCSAPQTEDPEQVISMQQEIFELFVRKKTKWHIVDSFTDTSERQNKGEQPGFQRLIENKDNYDMVLVQNVNDIHERTATFANLREELQLDIYSLRDGLIKYRKEL